MKTSVLFASAAAAALLWAAPAIAQSGGPPSTGCAAKPAHPATPPAQGADSGTKPGGDGSTAWSGGTGGSYIGTSPGAPTPASPTDHPPTVQGVNPSVVGPVRRDC